MKHSHAARQRALERAAGGQHSVEEWRCHRCDKLLGRVNEGRLHLRFARQHEYHATLPASCTCRGCGALNELNLPTPPRSA